ncbi:beta-lactamase/transpeptidase-like protein [Mycena capillaripes]|nr:beta-lactamase/transpeptidase-like protein [Mycena capillaripes]
MDSFETALAKATTGANRDLLGAIGLIVDNTGKVLYHHAAGNQSLDSSAPLLNPDSTITLGSAGKFVMHIAALQCVDRKLLGLDNPLSPWLPKLDSLQVIKPSDAKPGFTLCPPVSKITLLDEIPPGVAHAAANADTNMLIKLFARPLLFDPGAGYCYGTSIYFTGLLLARITKETSTEYVQMNIFTPLGMNTSTLSPQTREDVLRKLLPLVRRMPEGLVPVEGPTCDMMVSVSNLGVLLADLIAPAGSKIFSPKSVDLLFAPQLDVGSKALSDQRSEKELENYAAPAGIASPGSDLAGKGAEVNWSMAGLLVEGDEALLLSKIPLGTVTWNGMPNVVWAMHRERGVGMLFATQRVPVDDEKAVAVMMEFLLGAWTTYGNTA